MDVEISSGEGHILVVDDAAFMRRLLSRMLHEMGLAVQEAPDGVAAMRLLQKETLPALVVLDIMMPHMSGIELCRWMRMTPETQDIPVIICTAHHDRKTLERAIKAGATDIICKPVTMAAFSERLRKHLSTRARAQTR